MTDTEKINLIAQMIADFWGNHGDNEITTGGAFIVSAINTVVEFENEKP